MAKIAFLGLGAMGARMAARLVAAGHDLTVWNRDAGREAPSDAMRAATPRAAATGAQIVIAMLRDDAASQSVWTDPASGALGALGPGMLAIECSTLTVGHAQALAQTLAASGAGFVEAPVLGSRPQAEAGALIFLASGAPDLVAQATPVLRAMGGAVHAVGTAPGQGMALKLMANALFAAQVAALAEVLALGDRLGLAPAAALAILAETPVLSPAAKGAGGGIVARAWAPQFPIDLVEKDLGYVATTARSVGAEVPLLVAVQRRFATAAQAGHGADNITAIARLY